MKTAQHWFTHVELTGNICLCWGLFSIAMAHNSPKKFLIIILLWKFTHVELRGNICLLWLCDIFGLQGSLSFLVFMTWVLPTLLGFLRVFLLCSLVLWFFFAWVLTPGHPPPPICGSLVLVCLGFDLVQWHISLFWGPGNTRGPWFKPSGVQVKFLPTLHHWAWFGGDNTLSIQVCCCVLWLKKLVFAQNRTNSEMFHSWSSTVN